MQLASLKARMAVKGVKEPLYQKYVQEITTMVTGLNDFLDRCETAMAEVNSVSVDTADDKVREDHRVRLEGLCTTDEGMNDASAKSGANSRDVMFRVPRPDKAPKGYSTPSVSPL